MDTKPHNADFERPATLSLLPAVCGLRALDAGCRPGVYAEWLAERGAEVIAIDANDEMVRLARQRLGDKAKILDANLEMPPDILEDGWSDLVVSPLGMDYLKQWEPVFREFHGVLKAGGHPVFSIDHPTQTRS